MRRATLGCLAVVAAAVLYGAAETARAQDTPDRLFSVGDTISLAYPNESESRCIVGDVLGQFVRCDASKEETRFAFNRPKVEAWYNLATVKYITKSTGR
jgi:hypothetical protein